MKNLFLLVALFCSVTIAAQENALYVAAKTGLNIREKPETTAKVLDKIPYAEKSHYRKQVKEVNGSIQKGLPGTGEK